MSKLTITLPARGQLARMIADHIGYESGVSHRKVEQLGSLDLGDDQVSEFWLVSTVYRGVTAWNWADAYEVSGEWTLDAEAARRAALRVMRDEQRELEEMERR